MRGLNAITIVWEVVTDAGEQIQKWALVRGILNPPAYVLRHLPKHRSAMAMLYVSRLCFENNGHRAGLRVS
jgi:hypothetical protein